MKDHVRWDCYRVKFQFWFHRKHELPANANYVSLGKKCSKTVNSETDEGVYVYHIPGVGYGILDENNR